MTQATLDFTAPKPKTLCDHLAAYFQARPNQWIDGRELAKVAGAYAWRSRCADIRRAPWHLTIKNRLRRVDRPDGSKYTISEYRLVV